MIPTQHTHSLNDFREKETETLDRINRTGEAEILTVNGEARAVLMSPAAYHELARESQLTRDITVIRKAIQEVDKGKGQESGAFFDGLRAQLLTMKSARKKGATK